MLAWGAPPGLLPRMEKLRWAQALTAGVETWLALPDLPPALTLTCARGTHRESMAENILGALFHLTKPYAAIVQDQKQSKWVRRVAWRNPTMSCCCSPPRPTPRTSSTPSAWQR
jgi:phosphoglycerate dehydrogenase-like enzyme